MNETVDDTPALLSILERRYGGEIAAEANGWGDRGGDARDFLYAFGSAHAALLYAVLFVPQFIEIEGAVFLKDFGAGPFETEEIAKRMRSAKEKSSEALKACVRSYNWIELPYAFRDVSGTNDEYTGLAGLLAEAWRVRLQHVYPGRRFVVRVLSPEETGSVVGIGIEEEL
jgi:hypothetical protein